MPAYILWRVVRVHGDGYNQTVYKWSVRTVTENNKDKRTIGLPRENNRVSVQGRSQNRVGLMVTRWGVMPSPKLCPRAALSRNKEWSASQSAGKAGKRIKGRGKVERAARTTWRALKSEKWSEPRHT